MIEAKASGTPLGGRVDYWCPYCNNKMSSYPAVDRKVCLHCRRPIPSIWELIKSFKVRANFHFDR